MPNDALKVLDTAGRITSLVNDGLSGLERAIAAWPDDFRAIIWETVAHVATTRAEDARRLVSTPSGSGK